MPAQDFKLGRLKKRSEFLYVRDGAYRAVGGVVVQMRQRAEFGARAEEPGHSQVRTGFTATKKIGNAVKRNRARRRLKAAVNLVLPLYARPGHDYVFIARASTLSRPFEDLCRDMEKALKALSLA